MNNDWTGKKEQDVLIILSVDGVPIRLTDERWGHISRRHPELKPLKNQVLGCVGKPNFIQRGDSGEKLAVAKIKGRYLVVAYREVSGIDGFILTGYLTRQYSSKREVLWKPDK